MKSGSERIQRTEVQTDGIICQEINKRNARTIIWDDDNQFIGLKETKLEFGKIKQEHQDVNKCSFIPYMIPSQNIGHFWNFVATLLSLTCKGKKSKVVDSADRYNELLRTTKYIWNTESPTIASDIRSRILNHSQMTRDTFNKKNLEYFKYRFRSKLSHGCSKIT